MMSASMLISGKELRGYLKENHPELLRNDHAGSGWRGDDGHRPWDAYLDAFEEIVQGRKLRFDVGETATFRDALTSILSETLVKKYPSLRAAEFIPMNVEANPGARKIKVVGYEGLGEATRLTNYAEDVSLMEVQGIDRDIPVVGSACGWAVGFQQLREMAQARANGWTADIDQIGTSMARLAVLTDIDGILAQGDAAGGVQGFTNLAGVTILIVVNGAWNGGVTTPAQILADIIELQGQVRSTRVWFPDTFLLPTVLYQYLSVTMIPNTAISLLTWLKTQLPWLKTIDEWDYLDTAGAGGVPRAVMYQRTPEVVRGFTPVALEALAPIEERLRTISIFHARCAGCHSANTVGMAYSDNLV